MSARRPPRISRRAVLAGAAGIAAGGTRAEAHSARVDSLLLNDASRLNPTKVARHTVVDADADDAVIAALRRLLAEAGREGLPVVVGGARHSMGGQSLRENASAVTTASRSCVPDKGRRVCRLASGARWHAVVPALDRVGLSIAVMQSNSDFSVGGTLSVNGHGWAVPYGAFASTVRAFRLMLADGTLLTCSASENRDLFAAAIGGYGLLGIIVDADVDVVDNIALRPLLARMEAEALPNAFVAAVRGGSELRLAYARLSTDRASFLSEALLVTFERTDGEPEPLRVGDRRFFGTVSRALLRAQTGSDAGKAARWWAESRLGPRLAPATVSRNRLLVQPVSSLGEPGGGRTDILHEYFLPPALLGSFLAACRTIIPEHGQDLLNVTLRYVAADPVSLLTFAPEPRIAAVMLFSQSRTTSAERLMRLMTEVLIDEALARGGSFYLPYRLHARPEQVVRAYPGLQRLLDLKRRHDPKARFRNQMLDCYVADGQLR